MVEFYDEEQQKERQLNGEAGNIIQNQEMEDLALS